MDLQDELTNALEDGYKRAGDEVGYWGRRFLQAVRRNGGLVTAKRMLRRTSTTASPRTMGLDALLKANRPDLTVEAIVLRDQFRTLFTPDELKVAEERLGEYGKQAARHVADKERLYPDELEPGQKYMEGARRQIRVNAYERNRRARQDCLKHHGLRCAVCDLLFEQVYGELGKGFIHVHHLRPLALCDAAYRLDAVEDLRPVCPNCHAMLHYSDKVLSIEELKAVMSRHSQPVAPRPGLANG
jgi:5-methylcytosine-specific restriction protein A